MIDRPELSAASLDYLERTDAGHRKRLGQYFTPASLRSELVARLPLFPGARVLDPGVGSGEFLRSVREAEPRAELFGWECDADLVRLARRVVPGASIERRDALEPYDGEPFDFVVGNPPYFEVDRSSLRADYADVVSGRPNIFAMFFKAGLGALKDGGSLAFVVPASMNNGAYFEALRRFLVAQGEITYLRIVDGADLFEGAQQAVQLLVVRKGGTSRRYQFRRSYGGNDLFGPTRERIVFAEKWRRLESEFDGRTTLYELGYRAQTGHCVWNQRRSDLRREPDARAVPLIWAHNLVDGRLRFFDDHKRPQYVIDARPLLGPALVSNRITGAVGAGELRVARVPRGMRFVGENHVNVIVRRDDVPALVAWDRLLRMLQADGVSARVRLLTGNTQISATELTHFLPLDRV